MNLLNDYTSYAKNNLWVIGSVSVILLYLINWYRRPKRLPPGPRGFPVVGYLPFMGKRPEQVAYNLSKKYGNILTIRMGTEDVVFLNDYDSVQNAFVKNGGTLSGRRPLPLTDGTYGLGSLDYGPMWKSQRKFGLMTLRRFGVGKKQMENICLEELNYLNEELRKSDEKPFNMSKFIKVLKNTIEGGFVFTQKKRIHQQRDIYNSILKTGFRSTNLKLWQPSKRERLLDNAISNNICGVTMGRRFDYDDEDFSEIIRIFLDIFGSNKLFPFVNRLILLAPGIQHVPPISFIHKTFLRSVQKLLDWVNEIVKEHEKTFDENNIRDFVDAFIVEKRKGSDDYFEDIQLLYYIFDLFLAGTRTTSNTLYWSLLCMLHYPEAQNKLREEIMKVVGPSGTLSMTHKADMSYTNAFIQEVYRYRTLVPLGVPHKANADTELNGYVIPKGIRIFSNLWAVHNDPTFWKNPEKFLPERFLDEKGNFISSNYVVPFSVGPRHCLGEQLARMEVFIFLVGMVQKFEFLSDPNADQLPSIEDGTMGLGCFPKQYSLVAKEL